MTSYRNAAKATPPEGTKGKRATCCTCGQPVRRESKSFDLWRHAATGSLLCSLAALQRHSRTIGAQ